MQALSIAADDLTIEDIHLDDSLTLVSENGTIGGNIIIGAATLTIPAGSTVTVSGNISAAHNSAILKNDGDLTVTGNVAMSHAGNPLQGSVVMENDTATLRIGGNLSFDSTSYSKISAGTVVFNGTQQQTVQNLRASTVISENQSEGGIVFSTPITISTLFNHKGNLFELYSNGMGSSFADYDVDGLTDDIDPKPIVPRRCALSGTAMTIRMENRPADCSIVAARYNNTGRMVEVLSITPVSEVSYCAFDAINSGDQIKVFFLNSSIAPSGEAEQVYMPSERSE